MKKLVFIIIAAVVAGVAAFCTRDALAEKFSK